MGEDLLRTRVIRHICQRDKNGEKAENMEDKNQALETGQQVSSHTVNTHGENSDGPKKESPMPILRLITRVCEDDKTLYEGSRKKARCCKRCLPSDDSEPA